MENAERAANGSSARAVASARKAALASAPAPSEVSAPKSASTSSVPTAAPERAPATATKAQAPASPPGSVRTPPAEKVQRLVAYERVSTARQGRSGLGLEAQRAAIDRHASETGAAVLARFTEVESGGKVDRPELDKALHLARLTGATLVIAKLDRLSRNAAFLLTLQASGARFLAVDMPQANDLTVGIMALVAQAEREAISRRTKEALAAAKARGTRLGNPNGAAALRRAGKGGTALRATVTANADQFAKDLAPVLAELRVQGHTTLRAIAAELEARGMQTRRGGRWHVSNVKNLLKRIARLQRPAPAAITDDPKESWRPRAPASRQR